MKKIMIIDDEAEMLNSIRKILERRKEFQLEFLQDAKEALRRIGRDPFDLIISDLKMKHASGMDVLDAAREKAPGTKVIIISGYGTIESSVEAMRKGAADFLEKPFTAQKLYNCIDIALEAGAEQGLAANDDEAGETDFEGIIYGSDAMRKLLKLVRKIADSNICVLITGESGTGKELIARAIHKLSPRRLNPFIPVNCGALPEHLFESELFGHERGAFTGAVQSKPGLLEFSDTGTFFLDEIGELSPELQVKLLRILQEKKIRRVGGTKEIKIDVRILAATNRNLEDLVERGLFREDLYYRLTAMKIDVPPLRERVEDIPMLAQHFMQEICKEANNKNCRISPSAIEKLKAYPWPGNIRELQNTINRAFYLRSSELIEEEDFPLIIAQNQNVLNKQLFSMPYSKAKETMIQQFEIEYLKYHLKLNKGNVSRTAISCGLDRRTIHRLINKYQIVFKD